MRGSVRQTVLVIFLIVSLAGFFVTRYILNESQALKPDSQDFVSITIPQGASTKTIASILKETGIIDNEIIFLLMAKIDKYDGRLQAGSFSLGPSMTMNELMESMLSGRADTVRFTVPEGLDIERVANLLSDKGLVNKEKFLYEIENGEFDYWFIDSLPRNSQRLEGFLFPETYEIYADADEHAIIDRMLGQFDRVFNEDHKARLKEVGKDIFEVITLASIIEREALVSEDRPVISGVFQNRLKIDMALQSCATIQYILGEQKPVLSTADTQIESPYNTYIHTGLPPGPIASPGMESIDAALWPKESDYLFFLAKGDGSHVFSKTYEEHLKYKAMYIDK